MTDSALILLVDDSAMQRQLYTGLLKASGYRVLVGGNGRQGIELALQHQPDLILMDISMPDIDGVDAVQELRGYPQTSNIPILALTGTTEPEDLELALQAGYDDWIFKSNNHALALDKVRHWLAALDVSLPPTDRRKIH